MTDTIIALIVTSAISILSLFISLRGLIISKPKLKISITDKSCDVYYGLVATRNDKIVPSKVGAALIHIINNSPVDIAISEIRLKIGGDYYRLVDTENTYWKDCNFFYYNNKEEKEWDGVGINYDEEGLSTPLKVRSYSIESGICLFHDFPNVTGKKVVGTIVLYSAVGKIKKRVKFIEYNKDYVSAELKEVRLYVKNYRGEKE